MKSRKSKKKPVRKRRVLKVISALLALAILFPVGFFLYVYLEIPAPIPTKKALQQIENPEASVVYDTDHKILGKYYIYERTSVELEKISDHVVDALISTEDARFFEHEGVDFRSLMRVLFKTVLLGDESSGGGSTISQQLAKNLYPRQDYGFLSMGVNKIREMIIASRMEDIYTKEEILTIYLNTVPFGDNVYGIESASFRYFSKPSSQLDVHEAATLVGMLKGNTLYNPRINPERSLERRNVVISLMLKEGFINGQEEAIFRKKPLDLKLSRLRERQFAGYFLDVLAKDVKHILEEIGEADSNKNIYTDGLRIYTTIDRTLQDYAEKAVSKQMSSLQKVFDQHWQSQKPWNNRQSLLIAAIENSPQYASLESQGLGKEKIMQRLNEKKKMEVYTWEGTKEVEYSTVDSIKHYLMVLHAGMVALDPQSGYVRSWVGGVDHDIFKYDHVNKNTKRQVGSTFKPFVYATALERNISPCNYYKASQETFVENNQEWTPSNADEEYEGKYSMQGALKNSVNTVSVKILEDVGVTKVIDKCREMGIESDIPPYPSIALGTPSISLLEMAAAYASFANDGRKVAPVYLLKIEDKNGKVLWEREETKSEKVWQPETASLMIEMLRGVVNEGTGARLRGTYKLNNDIAGKTGTTQNNADGWFIGITPNLVTAVWVGADNPAIHFRTTALGQGANTALPIFAEYFQKINSDREYQNISQPRFRALPKRLEDKLDCDPFKEEFKLFEFLFGKKKDKDKREEEKKDKPGIFKKIGNIFKKKDK